VDFAMPGMNGAEVAHRVQRVDQNLPVLIVSGFAQTATLAELAGPEMAMLRKPFRNRELLDAATRLLGKKAA